MNTLRPIDDDDWEAMMEVNFLAILFMYLIAHCVETEKGQVGKLYISGYILMETWSSYKSNAVKIIKICWNFEKLATQINGPHKL